MNIISIPSQKKMKPTISAIPVEYFEWGTYPDHFKIEMPHRHQFAELLFFSQGGGKHDINYTSHTIEDYSIHYIPKSTTHFLERSPESSGFTIAFDTNFFEINDIHSFINPLKHEPCVLNITKERFDIVLGLTQQILYQIKQQKSYYRKKCFLLSMELLLNMIAVDQNLERKYERTAITSELVREFKYLVNTNYHSSRLVSWYANQLNISSKHLGNKVKEELGISAKDYIVSVILTSVKRQLLDTKKSIKQIAFEHHYDLSSLGKLFKKNVGYNMKEYRS